jgi:hypothetical protein
MTTLRAMIVIPMTSALPADSVVNTFYFTAPAADATAYAAIDTALTNFYGNLQSFFSSKVNANGTRIKIYDMEDLKPRPPKYDALLGLGATVGTTALPPELAVCLSFQGARVAGIAQARRRGRIYFGPLAQVAVNSDKVHATFVSSLCTQAGVLLAATSLGDPVQWVVYSQTQPGPNFVANVTDGWVDNALDVQRRRGLKADTRTAWT